MDYDQFTDEDWNKEFAHLQDNKTEINPVLLNQIVNQQEEIERLRKQVQELERSAKAWEEDALRYHKDAEYWKGQTAHYIDYRMARCH